MSFEVLFLLLVQLAEHPLAQHLREPDDGVQRRPQLVGHVGQELGLVLLATSTELFPTRLNSRDVLDGDHGLVGEGLEQGDLSLTWFTVPS